MAKPVILAVDDDPQGVRAVGRDPRPPYAREYRILRADSGESALDTLGKLKLRGDPVALFLVDQRMPKMTGVEFLEQAIERYPEAKRALLTAYSDTEAAIRAINDVGLDYYLQKPWDPPDENLYPNLDDMLGDWQAGYRPPFTGLRVVGDRWSPESHRTREFLALNRVPYRWMDIEGSEEAREIVANADSGAPKLPLVVYEDGSYAEAPQNREIAEKIGLQTRAGQQFYDLVIAGGGPSGLAAAVYGASEGLKTVLIEREAPGGQAGTSSRIDNYLGFPAGLSGDELASRALQQARRLGAEILVTRAILRIDPATRHVHLDGGDVLRARTIILACGVSWRRLGLDGFERLAGRGISYGASRSDAPATHGEDIHLVGAGNSAGQAALFLSTHARSVTILCRGDTLTKGMSRYLVDQIAMRANIAVRLGAEVAAVHGEEALEAIDVRDRDTGAVTRLHSAGLFF